MLLEKLQTIPELQKVFLSVDQGLLDPSVVLGQYEKVLLLFSNLSEADTDAIGVSRNLMTKKGVKLHSASKLHTSDFLRSTRQIRSKIFDNCLDFTRSSSQEALQKLFNMLERGSEIASGMDTKPVDGDLVWDNVIWGHTQANSDVDPQVLFQFVVSHYICQYANIVIGAEYGLKEKDDFINVLADLVLLGKQRGWIDENIYNAWIATKKDGGLGWIDEQQEEIYRKVLSL